MPQGSWNSSAGQGRWPPGEQEELHRCSRAQFWMPAEEKLVCVGRESNPGQLLGRQLCSPLYHQREESLLHVKVEEAEITSVLLSIFSCQK